MASIFSKIVVGQIPAYVVAENESFMAFLDVSPIAKGHILVIPKKETDYIFDIENDEYTDLFLFAKRVAAGLKKAMPCNRIGVCVIGLEVPHAHIHLVPINHISDMSFEKTRLKFSEAEFSEIAANIRENTSIRG